ncbi:hypothetical protein [Ensifer sp. LC163]|uniref:hypothetical protein n=1 Tax=Ensifer sp. LC163 TaxID=1120652 RepID=UPI0008137CA4|nr:hypothetical protein [Ensifer sp. LC163]OCP38629.1 hypothetical protein BC360_00725 [Ensifer sp. LC163]
MRRLSSLILSALLLAAAASPVTAIGQSGEPRYLVKVFLLKTDKTFDHATGWCGQDSVCTLMVGDYLVGLRFFLSGESYRLRVKPSSDGDDRCCVFKDGSDEASVANGRPHDERLYYRTASGRRELGTLYIALENLE